MSVLKIRNAADDGWIILGGKGGADIIQQASEPTNPTPGMLWLDTDAVVTGTALSVYRSGTQTVNNATYTKCQYNAEYFDLTSEWDTTNYKFTVTTAGVYAVTHSLMFTTYAGWAAGEYLDSNITLMGLLLEQLGYILLETIFMPVQYVLRFLTWMLTITLNFTHIRLAVVILPFMKVGGVMVIL